MAGGSYSQRPVPEEPTGTLVPARATRQLPAVREAEELEERITRRLPEVHPGTGIPIHRYAERPLARHRTWLGPFIICMVIVVSGSLVLISAGIFQRTDNSHLVTTYQGGQSYAIQVGGSIDNVNLWLNSNEPLPPKKPIPTNPGPYSVLGKPTITVDFINQVLASYNSPAAGKGQALYNYGVKYGIDPIYALAFFLHESTMGTTGVAQKGLVTVDQIIPVYAPSSDHNDVKGYIAALKRYIDVWHAGILRP